MSTPAPPPCVESNPKEQKEEEGSHWWIDPETRSQVYVTQNARPNGSSLTPAQLASGDVSQYVVYFTDDDSRSVGFRIGSMFDPETPAYRTPAILRYRAKLLRRPSSSGMQYFLELISHDNRLLSVAGDELVSIEKKSAMPKTCNPVERVPCYHAFFRSVATQRVVGGATSLTSTLFLSAEDQQQNKQIRVLPGAEISLYLGVRYPIEIRQRYSASLSVRLSQSAEGVVVPEISFAPGVEAKSGVMRLVATTSRAKLPESLSFPWSVSVIPIGSRILPPASQGIVYQPYLSLQYPKKALHSDLVKRSHLSVSADGGKSFIPGPTIDDSSVEYYRFNINVSSPADHADFGIVLRLEVGTWE